jgi:hypothetical protein
VNKKLNAREIMETLWDAEKNKSIIGKTFDHVTTKHSYLAFWNCDFGRSCPSTKKSPKQVYQAIKNGCAVCEYCKGNPIENSVLNVTPEMVERYWNYERNNALGIFPEYTTHQSNKSVYVKCEKHNWGINEVQSRRCADLAKKRIPCPFCNGKKASEDNNLKLLYPIIAGELHPSFDPYTILPASSKKYPWWCELCQDYYYKEVRIRTAQNQGCPVHRSSNRNSKTEGLLRLIFNKTIGNFEKSYLNDVKWLSGHQIEIDNYEKILKVAIEYDGKWHNNELQISRDQMKNDLIKNHKDILLFIRIREKGLPSLHYHSNQIEVSCEKYESSFRFLIPTIQKTIQLVSEHFDLKLKIYTEDELTAMIKQLLPQVDGNAISLYNKVTFGEYAPGLIQYLGENNRNPYTIAKGSNHVFSDVKCPNCGALFSNHKSKAKILVRSMGLCKECLHCVKDIHDKNSPLVRWSLVRS